MQIQIKNKVMTGGLKSAALQMYSLIHHYCLGLLGQLYMLQLRVIIMGPRVLSHLETLREIEEVYVNCVKITTFIYACHAFSSFVVATALSTDTTITNSVAMGVRVYYRLLFASTGVTIRLDVGVGYIVCYASDTNPNPNAVQGYNWKVETSGYIDTYIDPALLGRPAGQYIYICLEGNQNSNTFSINSTFGDRRGNMHY